MTIRQLAEQLAKKSDDMLAGAKALAERLEEKKKAGKLVAGEEQDWHIAILANVKRAEELRADAEALKALIG